MKWYWNVPEDIPEKEKWLYLNPKALESVLTGINQAERGEYAPVTYDSNGVAHVKAVDILNSRKGREEIQKASNYMKKNK
jgi:hypothetical protein